MHTCAYEYAKKLTYYRADDGWHKDIALVPGLPQYVCALIVQGRETFEIREGLG